MRYKKLLIFIIFLLILGSLNVTNTNSYAGWDDLIVMGIGCAVGGLWNPIWGGGQCGIWSPPKLGDCNICNKNPLQECSEYQCKAIGKNCNLLNGKCVDIFKGDTSSPKIIDCKKISKYEEYKEKRQAVYSKDVCNFGEIVKGKGVVAALTTNELAMCKFDVEIGKDYDEMSESHYFEIFNEFSLNHYLVINPGEELSEELIKKCENGGCRLFIRCSDVAGNKMKYDYAFVFEIKGAGEDITPPSIEFGEIDSGYVMKYNDNVLDFGLIADDGTGVKACKYSMDDDKDYKEMSNSMTCYGERPAACSTTLTNIKNNVENKFYFRCEDKKGNVNNIGKELIINGGNLLGMQISVPGTITKTSKINIATNGGGDDNNAICYYRCDKCNINDYVLFDSTGINAHEQELYFIPKPGSYDIKIKCEDSAGDIVEETKNLNVEAIQLNVALLNKIIDKQKIAISVQTSNGEKNGEADCNLFKDINHKYGDLGSKGLENLNENKHVIEINELQNGHYDWSVVCSDIYDNENYALVSFDINTDNLEMGINPPSGTNLEGFNVRVTITTTRGVDGEGNSVCKIKAPENGFIDKDQFEGDDIENGKKLNIHVIDLPSAIGLFGQTNNVYYIVCKDDAGKTNGQIITYNVNLAKSDLLIGDFKLDNKAELKTDKINPVFSFVTTGGKNLDGEANCDVECSQNGDKIYGNSLNTNNHIIKFSNLKDGSYNCKISCEDPEFLEREAREVDKSFVVETPALVMSLVDYPNRAGTAKIKLQTTGGIGQPKCYYADHYSADFEEKGYFDITNAKKWVDKAYEIPNVWKTTGIYNHLSGNINFKTGETYFIQCKDQVGKLSNYERFSIS